MKEYRLQTKTMWPKTVFFNLDTTTICFTIVRTVCVAVGFDPFKYS